MMSNTITQKENPAKNVRISYYGDTSTNTSGVIGWGSSDDFYTDHNGWHVHPNTGVPIIQPSITPKPVIQPPAPYTIQPDVGWNNVTLYIRPPVFKTVTKSSSGESIVIIANDTAIEEGTLLLVKNGTLENKKPTETFELEGKNYTRYLVEKNEILVHLSELEGAYIVFGYEIDASCFSTLSKILIKYEAGMVNICIPPYRKSRKAYHNIVKGLTEKFSDLLTNINTDSED